MRIHGKNGFCTIRPGWLLRSLILNPFSLRMGISGDSSTLRYVLITATKGGKAGTVPVAWGEGKDIPFVLRIFVPAIARADIGLVPVAMMHEEIGNEDPDSWIDRNETRIIPQGFTADRIETDFATEGTSITAVSVEKSSLDARCSDLESRVTCAAILPPLQGLASAYRDMIREPYILWKIDTGGSVLALVENGKVRDVCHAWPDTQAFDSDPKAVVVDIVPLLVSLGRGELPRQLMFVKPAGSPELPADEPAGTVLIEPPAIPKLPGRFHEAYGNALYDGDGLQLLPFHKKQQAEARIRLWGNICSGVRLALTALLILTAIGAGQLGLLRLLRQSNRTAVAEIEREYAGIQLAKTKRDSLKMRLDGLAALVAKESSLTRLLSDLQEVFPEGTKAERITIVERDAASWNLVILAFSRSGSLMQPVITALQKIEGSQNVHLVYSERVAGKQPDSGTRFRVEAVWR